MTTAALRERLRRLLEPDVTAAGCDLDEIVVTPAGRRRVLRVVVDRDGGVALDDVAALTRALSRALDASDVMGDSPYTLEVTSPGVDRPLTEPRHWRRAVGRLVTARLAAGGSQLTGRVLSVDGDRVVIATGEGQVRHACDELRRARVQVEFAAPASEELP